MEVLKDASATAIYGSRGSNGVILITTKSGRSGEAKIDFSYNLAVSSVAKKLQMLSGREYAEYANIAWANTLLINGQSSFYPGAAPYVSHIDAVTGEYV